MICENFVEFGWPFFVVGAFLCGTVQGLAILFALSHLRFDWLAGLFWQFKVLVFVLAAAVDLAGRLVVWILCVGFLMRILIIYPRWALQGCIACDSLPYFVHWSCSGWFLWLLVRASGSGTGSGGDQCLFWLAISVCGLWRVGSVVLGSTWCPQLVLSNSLHACYSNHQLSPMRLIVLPLLVSVPCV